VRRHLARTACSLPPTAADVGVRRWGATTSPAGEPAGGQVGARVCGGSARDGEEAELMPPFFFGRCFVLCECEIFPRLFSVPQVRRERERERAGWGG
jgi:hypothetical protein